MGVKTRSTGRPSKFSDKIQKSVKLLALKGFTDKEMAEALGITEQTLNNWKKAHPIFFESLKDWKLEADQKVVRSLYERAQGYSCPETKAQWVECDVFDPKTKTWKREGRWEYAELTKHYPPDPTSMIYWTKNRMKEWSDKQETHHTGDINIIRKEYKK